MKLVKSLLTVALAATALLTVSCESNKGGGADTVSPQVLKAFAEQYPGAQNVSWAVKGDYAVASFYWAGGTRATTAANCSAWFNNAQGAWSMTESEILYSELPQAVKTAFEASEYATWQRDNSVDVLTRSGEVEPEVYVIEVTQAGQEMDLYYSPDGVLVKTMADSGPDYDYGDFIPSQPVTGVDEYIKTTYPNARIVDVDVEYSGTEVEIIDGTAKRELLFDANGAWQHTKTEMRLTDLPAAVSAAWAASEYAETNGYRLDDVDYYETSYDGNFYRLELESRNGDVKVKITPEGEVSIYEPIVGGSASGVPTNVDSFIAEQYPGARVLEKDTDKGYLEVEILHENRKKSVYFNGAGAWVKTTWEVRYNDLPAAVTSAINASEYATWEFDGADYVESPDSAWYEIELEQERSDREAKIRVSADGTMLP